MYHSEFLFSFLIFMFLAHIYTAILRVRTYQKVDAAVNIGCLWIFKKFELKTFKII